MTRLIRCGWLAVALATSLSFAAVAQAPKLQPFPSAEAAADALTDAIRRNDEKAVAAILGAGWRDFVPGSREDEDKSRATFLAAWDENHRIEPKADDRAVIEVGKTGFVMPIPLAKGADGWRFDTEAGRKELTARFIGRNELAVVQTLLAIVDAQQEYATLDPMKVGIAVYARRLVSSPGKMDGLYWTPRPSEPESPLGPAVAKAQVGDVEQNGYYGYRFRLLYSQGPAAPGGAYDYLINGRMRAGFGVVAWPVRYGETGVMTFIVSQSGDVYEQDLGPDTAQKAAAITSFNPDKDWQKADTTP
jgi:hypothetical protein